MMTPSADAAPSVSEFKKVMGATRRGDTYLPDHFGRHKFRQMKFCLADAKRIHNREHMRNAKTMALYQDSRKGRLAVRFPLADDALQRQCGVRPRCRVQTLSELARGEADRSRSSLDTSLCSLSEALSEHQSV